MALTESSCSFQWEPNLSTCHSTALDAPNHHQWMQPSELVPHHPVVEPLLIGPPPMAVDRSMNTGIYLSRPSM